MVQRAVEGFQDGGRPTEVHFVYPVSQRVTFGEESAESIAAGELLDIVSVWAEEDVGENADAVEVKTSLIRSRDYLFSHRDYANALEVYARSNDIGLVVFDPEYYPAGTTPLLPTLEAEVRRAGVEVEEAPVQRERRGPVLVRRGNVGQFLALFGLSFLFYVLLSGSVEPTGVVTGAITGAVVAVSLWRVSLTAPIHPVRTARRLWRMLFYVPYLLWEIFKANLEIAYIVLHPDLPIDPQVVDFDAAVWSPLAATALANSITLTPGTLTVDITPQHFTIHTLTRKARTGLMAGGLERGVRFVFYGLAASRTASPAERLEQRGEDS